MEEDQLLKTQGSSLATEQSTPNMYRQVAIYASGNVLSVVFIIIMYQMNKVMADIREPFLFALVLSISLRQVKDDFIGYIDNAVWNKDATLMMLPVTVITMPARMVQSAWYQGLLLLEKWETCAQEIGAGESERECCRFVLLKAIHMYAYGFIKMIQGRFDDKKRRKEHSKKKISDVLIRWLTCIGLMHSVVSWIRNSWSFASQVRLLLSAILLMVASALVLTVQVLCTAPVIQGGDNHGGNGDDGMSAGAQKSVKERKRALRAVSNGKGWKRLIIHDVLGSFSSAVCAPFHALGSPIRHVVRTYAHSLVSALLICALIVGTGTTASFLTLKMVQEGRESLISVRQALSYPMMHGGNLTQRMQQLQWLASVQQHTAELVDKALPKLYAHINDYGFQVIERYNLTQAASEAQYLLESLQGSRQCSDSDKKAILVDIAKASKELYVAKDIKSKMKRRYVEYQSQLDEALGKFETIVLLNSSLSSFENGISLEHSIVSTKDLLAQAELDMNKAEAQANAAMRIFQLSRNRLDLCSHSCCDSDKSEHGVRNTTAQKMFNGYYKVLQWQVREGLKEMMNAMYTLSIRSLHNESKGLSFSDLHSFGFEFIGPMLQVCMRVFSSLESTTSAAVAGGLGIIKTGMGIVEFGMQGLLSLSLLFALLQAKEDPISSAFKILPLPSSSINKAAEAINESIGNVFVTLLKLAFIHGLFTWVTFQMVDAPLMYTSAVLSAVFSLLPLLPPYIVCIPAFLVLAFQQRVFAGVILFALHFVVAGIIDDMVLEEAGENSFLMSFAVLGGMWTFSSNPLLGCLFGPALLSLLNALAALHSEMFSDDAGSKPSTREGDAKRPRSSSKKEKQPVY